MPKILIIRLSAIGDVAMTIPVIYSVAEANPSDSFTVLTQTFLVPIFINCPPNVDIIGVNTKTTEKSFGGFLRYVFMLRKYKFDMVLDLHSVIRSRIVDFIFRLNGKSVFKIDKQRNKCKQLTAMPPKTIDVLRPVIERYADVFRMAGLTFENTFVSLYANMPVKEDALKEIAGDIKGYRIGIAPFAKHQGKIYPAEMMEKVIEALSIQDDLTIFLFGGRGEEEKILKRWEEKYKNTISIAGRYSLVQELELISRLDVLLSMDSANMHFASLVGTKVISIWGATHPYAGFYGYKQCENLAIQVDLPCRPCSIYGNKRCHRGDWACLKEITPELIICKIQNYFSAL
jgi:ADP-heptose:LPS heptosyltransferase